MREVLIHQATLTPPTSMIHPKNIGYKERAISVIGGPIVALLGVLRGGPTGIGLALAGSGIFYRGLTGYCAMYHALQIDHMRPATFHVEKSILVNCSATDLYRGWRSLANLPRFMPHVQSITMIDDRHSHWVVKGPAGASIEWDAEITEDHPNELIAWRSLPGARVPNTGHVRFQPLTDNHSTVVQVSFDYIPPAGALGTTIAALFGQEPGYQLEGDLQRFRNVMETTTPELATDQVATAQQSAAVPLHPTKPAAPSESPVQQASEDSFPASDPPAWIGVNLEDHAREVGT